MHVKYMLTVFFILALLIMILPSLPTYNNPFIITIAFSSLMLAFGLMLKMTSQLED